MQTGNKVLAIVPAAVLGTGLLALSACESEWRTLEPKDAGFVVTMPGAASCRKWREGTSRGELLGRRCEVEVEPRLAPVIFTLTTFYSVAWADLPVGLEADDIGAVLDEVWVRAVPEGQQIRKRQADLGGTQGFEFEAIVPMGDRSRHSYHVRERLCVRNNRLYRVSLVGNLDGARERTWMRMLGSFRFVSEEDG